MSSPISKAFLDTAVSIDAVVKETLVRPNPQRDYAITNSEKNGLPDIMISELQGQFLGIQARLIGAKSVLEIGTLGGYSTAFFAEAGCNVTSIEINPKHRDVALQNIAHAGHGDKVEVILGAALDVLPRLVGEGSVFDMVFIDADWGNQYEYFDWAVKLTRAKGCIYVDNVIWQMREEVAEGKDLSKESLPTKVGKDERVTATLIQTVAHHKMVSGPTFDGFILAIVN
ncbi:hypothetical protein VMCG_07624 [Cytospora schulzeri]|uniref:O-methyltransferase domain-containing protein n=1 Tax=Cytospora schulzeri TaxID=448051 RepID=A0A423VXB2_9PEZI|nr:hypothetical protein VMCG_07624 [Valsa malicola]